MVLIRSFFTAVQFLTRLPVISGRRPEEIEVALSFLFYPSLGLLIGGAGGMVYLFSCELFRSFPAAVLGIASIVLITGALHEDGLADSLDGFGAGGRDRTRILNIMSDSDIGTYGVVGLVLLILLKISLLADLSAVDGFWALSFSAATSRWVILPLAYLFPSAKESGLGAKFIHNVNGWIVLGAAIPPLLLGLQFFPPAAVLLVVSSFLGGLAWCWFSWRRIRGITGDVLGGAVQIAEIIFLSCVVGVVHG